MRCVIFPSASYQDGKRPPLSSFFEPEQISIVYGPTESGLCIIEGDEVEMDLLKVVVDPYYIMFEDFQAPTVH